MLTLALAATLSAFSDGLPARKPADVGMSAARLETIDRVVKRGIEAGGYPGAAVVVGRKGAAVVEKGYGTLDWSGKAPVVPASSIYDLASLTKVVGTTMAAMILYDEGKLELDVPVKKYVPAFSGGLKDQVTIQQLLTHRSGLPAGRDLWRIARTPAQARQAVINTKLSYKPGARYVYSDLGADMLGFVVEAISGEQLDSFLSERVFVPLGMDDTGFRPADSLRYRTAPTELAPPRGYPLRGEVHDENAHALGGVAGHAGLFSTAADLSIFAQMMLNGGVYNGVRVVSEETVRLFTTRTGTSDTRALGWDTADGGTGAGSYLSNHAFGHTGYTGTSMWVDPDREMFVILLTNRVHGARAKRPARVIADVRADLADAAAFAVVDVPAYYMATTVNFRSDHPVGWNDPTPVRKVTASQSARSKAAAQARAAKTSAARKAPAKAPAKKTTTKPAAAKAAPASATTGTNKSATTPAAKPAAAAAGTGKGAASSSAGKSGTG